MGRYYNRQGEPITINEWVTIGGDPSLRLVEQTELPDGRFISTVWLGIDHRYDESEGEPLIFETMVFPSTRDARELHCERYSTEEQARAGHARILAECLNGQHGGRTA